MWKTKVTGGVGDKLVLDCEKGLYSINSKGNLYRYDLINGKESLIYSLKVTSGVLIGNGGNLYLASDDTFYELNSNGEILWKSILGSNINGNPVMDEKGTVYVNSQDNKIYALIHAELKDPNLVVNVDDKYITVDIDSQATGDVIFTLEGNEYKNIFNKSIEDLSSGNYQLNISFAGDGRFNSVSKVINFTVKPKVLPEIESSKKDTVSVSLPSDATGQLAVTVGNETYTQELVNGKASIYVPGLDSSSNVVISYSGDGNYASFTREVNVASTKVKLTGSNLNMLYTSGSYYKVKLTQNDVALVGKTVTFVVNGKKITGVTDKNGIASVKITLAPKTYTVTAQYGSVKVSNKVVVKSIVSAKNINAKKSSKTLKIKVTLKKVNKKYLKGKKVTLKFNKKNFKVKTNKKGVATFTIKNSIYKKLKVGKKYTYQVTYLKDTVKKSIKFKK